MILSGCNFKEAWDEMAKLPGPVVQNYNEMSHIFSLMRDMQSYLEIGSAEGKTLFMASKAAPSAEITYVDLGEKHTAPHRNKVIENITNIKAVHGNSNDLRSYNQVAGRSYDVVMIDAGHDLFSVLVDACWYAPLAKKYVFFHDITIPDVNRVFEWYVKSRDVTGSYRVIDSQNFGYGVIIV